MKKTAFILGLFLAGFAACAQSPRQAVFEAQDTLNVTPDDSADAQQMLDAIKWEPGNFEVRCGPDTVWGSDALVRFPSAKPIGDVINDTVTMEWYAARDETGEVLDAPAVVVVHESNSAMPVGRMIAQALSRRGVHGIMLQLPGYGLRRHAGLDRSAARMGERLFQGIADARRARDAVAALPHINTDHIAIEGTSLGGFVTASAAGIDDAYESVWVVVSGGRIDRVLLEGKKDAAGARRMLEAAGFDETMIRELAYKVEPTRIAGRISPQRFFLYTAIADTVIPAACSEALMHAVGIPPAQHITVPGDHYTAILFLPRVIEDISQRVLGHIE